LLITVELAFAMEQMIRIGRNAMTDAISGVSFDYVHIERSESIKTRARKPERPDEVALQPEVSRQSVTDASSGSGIAISIAAPQAGVDMRGLFPEIGTGVTAVSDGEYLPIVKVAPLRISDTVPGSSMASPWKWPKC
jgi:protein TonB